MNRKIFSFRPLFHLYLRSSVFICGSTFLFVFALVSPDVVFGVSAVSTPTLVEDGKSLFEKAQKYFREKNYKEAKSILNQLVAKHPMEDYIPKARLLLANLQEDFTVSIAQFQSLATEYNNQPEGEEAQKNLGARYYLADKYSDAAESYKDFIQDHPKSSSMPEIRYWFASSLLAMDKNKEAAEEFKKVFHDAPDSSWAPKSLMGMATAYFKMKNYSEAQKQYLKVLDLYHFYDELNTVYFKLGQAYEAQQKPKEAHAAYQTLVSSYPKSLEVGEAKERLEALEKQHPELPRMVVAEQVSTPTPVVLTPVVPLTSPVAIQAQVKPTPVPETDLTQADDVVSKPFHVQVGVFSKKVYVDKAREGVKKAGYSSYVVAVKAKNMLYPLYKVRIGNFGDKVSAEKLARELTKKLKEHAIVVED